MVTKRILALLVGAIVAACGLVEIFREANPLSGSWKVERVVRNGISEEAPADNAYPDLEISGDAAQLDWPRWCGNMPDQIFARGVMIRKGSRIELHKRVRMTQELEESASAVFTVLVSGRLSLDYSDSDGPVQIEYGRIANANTLLDLFGWQ